MKKTCIIMLLAVGCSEIQTQESTEWCSKVCDYDGMETTQLVTFDERGRPTLTERYQDGELTETVTCVYHADVRSCTTRQRPWKAVDSVRTCKLIDGKEAHCDFDDGGDGVIDSTMDVEWDEQGREVMRSFAGQRCVMSYDCGMLHSEKAGDSL